MDLSEVRVSAQRTSFCCQIPIDVLCGLRVCVRSLDMAQVNAVIAKLKSMGFTPDPMSKEDMADGGELRDRSGADDGRIAHCLILSLHDRSCLSQSSSPSFVSCPITHVQYAARALKQTVRPVIRT